MPYLNAVIEAIDAGHVATHDGDKPTGCRLCGPKLWPCPTVAAARTTVRRLHGVKVANQ